MKMKIHFACAIIRTAACASSEFLLSYRFLTSPHAFFGGGSFLICIIKVFLVDKIYVLNV